MRRAFIFSLVFAMVSITACGENDHPVLSEQHEQANGEENIENQETDMENSIIKLTVGGRSFTATLVISKQFINGCTERASCARRSQHPNERLWRYGESRFTGILPAPERQADDNRPR